MAVNYEDDRFLQVEQEKNQALEQTNQQYDDLINERNDLTNQQNDLINKWEQTQNENLENQLQFQKDLIEQQKQEAQQAYEKEATSAYADYRKETDAYGVSKEQQAAAGVGNSGYSESSRVNMYNTYQNRLATSKETMDKAYIEFDNAIREAQLTNDATKAENALTALQQKLQIALESFNYKSEQTQNKLNWQYQINNDYYNRYQDVLNQINYENEQAEAIRQFNEQLALQQQQLEYQKQQDALAQQNWEREFALAQQASRSSGSSGSRSSGGSSGVNLSSGAKISTNYYSGSINPDTQYGTFPNVKDKNGVRYQPDNVGGNKLSNASLKVKDVFGKNSAYGSSGADLSNQSIWTTGNKYYVWDGSINDYIDITSQVKAYKEMGVSSIWG